MDMYTVKTEKMIYGGNCLAKINGKTVFVPGALPGETLCISIAESKQDYDTAKIEKIIEPSAHRVSPACPHYGTCGGCNMQHIDSAYQTELRKSILHDVFVRAGVSVPEPAVISGRDTGYRCRFQFHDGNLKKRTSGETVPVKDCIVAEPVIREILQDESVALPSGRIHVFGSSCVYGDDTVMVAEAALPEKKPAVTGKSKKKVRTGGKRQIYAGTTDSERTQCTVTLNGRHISFDIRGFFQSNMDVLQKTLPVLCSGLDGKILLDMYSGVGTLSLFASASFEKTILVEHNRDALVYAEQNMAGIPHESYGMSGSKWVKDYAPQFAKNGIRFDAVIIDPPRSGMEKEVCNWLCREKPPVIRSLSCDPVTHARDCAVLVAAGYTLKQLYLTDFYPQTSHIESLACLEYCP